MKIVYFENDVIKGARVYPFLKDDDPAHSAGYIEAQSPKLNPEPQVFFNINLSRVSMSGAAYVQAALATAMAIASETAMGLAKEREP